MRIGWMPLAAALAAVTGSGAGSGWTNIGPGGGRVASIAFDPHDPSTIYIGSGSCVLKSIDGGSTWNNSGLAGWSISKILFDPQNTATIYAQASFTRDEEADPVNKIFRSDDGGTTWNDMVTGPTLMAVDPQVSGTLYALAAGFSQGLFKSTDGGANWTRISGLPAGFAISGLAIDWQHHDTLYVAQTGVVSGRNVVTLMKSTDGGASWKTSDSGLPQTFDPGNGTLNILPFAQNGITIDPTNPNTVYAAKAATGVYKSTDGGASWKAANSGMPTSPTAICCSTGVVIDPRNPNVLYAEGGNPTNPTNLVIYKSTNGGLSWTAFPSLGAVGFQPPPLFIDPLGALYVPIGSSLRKSTDGGANWISVDLRLPAALTSLAIDPQSTLYAAVGNPLWKSTDTGGSWSPAGVGIPQGYRIDALVVDPLNPTSLFAGVNLGDCEYDNGSGVYASADGGATWTDARSGIGCGVTAIATDPQNPGTVYAANQFLGVSKSADGGVSWNATRVPGTLALALDPRNSGTVYAGTYNGVYKTTDGAASWSVTGLTSKAVAAVAVDAQNTSIVYAGTDAGLFQSTDGGVSWVNLLAAAQMAVYAVAVDPRTSGTIYVGTDDGVLQSTDGGANWSAIAGGPQHAQLLMLDPQNPGIVYAGGTGGLFMTR